MSHYPEGAAHDSRAPWNDDEDQVEELEVARLDAAEQAWEVAHGR